MAIKQGEVSTMAARWLASLLTRSRSPHVKPPDIFTDSRGLFADFTLIFDIGAHHGTFTHQLRLHAPRASVHSFEPFDKSYQVLRARFAADHKVTVNNKAVSNTNGSSSFHCNVGDETNSLLPSVPVDRQIDALTTPLLVVEVATTTLDVYASDNNISEIDFVKIDAQGNTFAVLEGARNLLTARAISWIYAEVEFTEIYEKEKRFSEIELLLRGHGYQLSRFYNMNYTEHGILGWADALFCLKRG